MTWNSGLKRALIVVTEKAKPDETEKGISLYHYLLAQGWTGDEIMFLAVDGTPHADAPPTKENIEKGFLALKVGHYEKTVYISDNSGYIFVSPPLKGKGGFNLKDEPQGQELEKIPYLEIKGWIDALDYSIINLLFLGPKSGHAGPHFTESGRIVICSMAEDDERDDEFDISIGLNHPACPQLDFVFAFLQEEMRLKGPEYQPPYQTPLMWM